MTCIVYDTWAYLFYIKDQQIFGCEMTTHDKFRYFKETSYFLIGLSSLLLFFSLMTNKCVLRNLLPGQ